MITFQLHLNFLLTNITAAGCRLFECWSYPNADVLLFGTVCRLLISAYISWNQSVQLILADRLSNQCRSREPDGHTFGFRAGVDELDDDMLFRVHSIPSESGEIAQVTASREWRRCEGRMKQLSPLSFGILEDDAQRDPPPMEPACYIYRLTVDRTKMS
jgi:hypothetical protein